jgi:hypothetical protein
MDTEDLAKEMAELRKELKKTGATLASFQLWCARRGRTSEKVWGFLGGVLGGLAGALGLRFLGK